MDLNTQPASVAARITAVAFGSVGTFMLFAASIVIPPLGFFSGILSPFPVVYFRLRHGRGTGVIITLSAVTVLTAVFGINAGIVYLLQCGVIALLLPEFLVKGYGAARTIAWTTACSVTLMSVAAALFTLVSGQNLHQVISNEITTSLSQAVAIYEKSGIKGDDLAMIRRSMDMAAALMIRTYPSVTTILLMFMVGCNVMLIRRPAVLMGYTFSIDGFGLFRLPEPLVWILIPAGFAMMAGNPVITTPALNVLIVVTTLYFLQGMAVATTVISRQPFAGIMRVFLYLMLLFQPYLAAIIAVIGIFDIWGDFRTPKKQENL
jgi:hypothetical protein